MTHIITTLIIIMIPTIPFLISRYVIYMDKAEDILDIIIYCIVGAIPILISALFTVLYLTIYDIIK